MAVSRPVLLALIGVVLLGATFFAVQNARNASSGDSAPRRHSPAQPQAADSAPQLTPKQQLEAAFANDDLESASFERRAVVQLAGREERDRGLRVPSRTAGRRRCPSRTSRCALDVESAGVKLDGGFVTTGDKAWFTRGDTAYAVPQDPWDKIVEARESGQSAQSAPPATPELNLEPGDWVRKVSVEDGGQIDGVRDDAHLRRRRRGRRRSRPPEADAGSGPASLRAPRRCRAARRQDARRRSARCLGRQGRDRPPGELRARRQGRRRPAGADGPALRVLGRERAAGRVRSVQVRRTACPTASTVSSPAASWSGSAAAAGVDASALGVPTTNAHVKAERAVAQGRKVVIFFENPRGLDDQAVDVSVRALKRETEERGGPDRPRRERG